MENRLQRALRVEVGGKLRCYVDLGDSDVTGDMVVIGGEGC
jgi:hypothetical protein